MSQIINNNENDKKNISTNIIMNNTYFTEKEINEMSLIQNEQYKQYEQELNKYFDVVELSNEDYENLINSL